MNGQLTLKQDFTESLATHIDNGFHFEPKFSAVE
jgi:predicted lipase